MRCYSCGAENTDYARFCVKCGSAIISEQAQGDFSGVQAFQPENYSEQFQHISQTPLDPGEQQPKSPKKKGKVGKIIAIVIAVLLLVGIGVGAFFAISSGWVEIKFNFNKEEEVPVEQAYVFYLNTPVHNAGPVKITLRDKYIHEGAVEPTVMSKDYETPLPDDPNAQYFVIEIDVTNVSKNNIDFNNIYMDAKIKVGSNEYDATQGIEVYYEVNNGTELSKNSTIMPNETKRVYFVRSLYNDYVDEYSRYEINFGFDEKLSSKPLTKGKEACDYIFNFVAVK